MNDLESKIRLLQDMMDGQTFTAAEAASHRGVGLSAARNILLAFEAALPTVKGEPDLAQPRHPMRWRFAWPSGERATWDEHAALAVAHALLVEVRGSQLDAALAAVLSATRRRLPPGHPAPGDLARSVWRLSRDSPRSEVRTNNTDVVLKAIHLRHVLEAEYHHTSASRARVEIEPYTLLIGDEALYVYGRCRSSDRSEHVDTRRVWNLARLHRVKETCEEYLYPPRDEYDPSQLFGHCFGVYLPGDLDAEPSSVVLEFHPSWSTWFAYESVHQTQTEPVVVENGWLQVKCSLFVTYDLVRWVRGHGRTLRAVGPRSLVEWVESGEGPGWVGPS